MSETASYRCSFYGCVCLSVRHSYIFELSKTIGKYVVSMLAQKEKCKHRWTSPLCGYFDAVVFARAIVDSLCMLESSQRWLGQHVPFVLDATKTLCSSPSLRDALRAPVVYAWFGNTESDMVYFGESERGFAIRIREEMEHIVKHTLNVRCSAAKSTGRCDLRHATAIASYGLHNMYVVPYRCPDAWELRDVETALIIDSKLDLC